MQGLWEPIRSEAQIQIALEHIEKKEPFLLSGAGDSVQNHLISAFSYFTKRPSVVVASNEMKAKEVYEELKFYDPKGCWYFPAKDPLFYRADVRGLAIEEDRMKVLQALREGKAATIVMSMEALYDRLVPQKVWESFILRRRIGDELPLEWLLPRLLQMGYERSEQVEAPGQFSVRGGIIDIYPITEDTAYRLEMWGDEIDSIRVLDTETQRSAHRLEYITVFPVSEIVISDEQREKGIKRIEAEAKEGAANLLKQNLAEEAQRLEEITQNLLQRLEEQRLRGLESYASLFYENTVTILDYLSPESVLYLQDPARIAEKAKVLEDELKNSLTGRLKKGYLLPGQAHMFPTLAEIEDEWEPFSRVYLCSLLGSNQNVFHIKDILRINSRSINVIQGDEKLLLDELRGNVKLNYRTVVLTDSLLRVQRMVSRILEEGLPAYAYEDMSEMPKRGSIAVAKGGLGRGFSYPEAGFVLISMKELSESGQRRRAKRRRKFKNGQKISSFSDLTVGDYVVHENHGVGIYHGIVQMEDGDSKRDYFKIVYKDGGALYVPTTSLDMLQRYVAGEDAKPKLNKLAGNDWQRTKTKVREGVAKLAEDLVALYAERQNKKGYQYGPDTVWQKEFEEAFPFEETDDQLTAIEDTKRDMESPQIMDRLICGDVGYGKTEVAIRAAFKAVQEGKQVAFLAPTTILAQQHYQTFVNRMRDYPVNIELLSRFRTPKQIKLALEGTRVGSVDILIGTHRLLSKDVIFKDLGLLVVDEEQRFGVSHKEKMKAMKKEVDVLTLSATPIPRTLHMSLNGMRDMSLLEDAPQHRQPIQTYVMEDDSQTVREAIYRELGRSGQVFYLHNRVGNIEEAASRVQEMVPEARVAFAHGQMSERELERVMLRFIEGEIDVLVCTTIIETGLDISNANTIIIENADTMGLAQLYQLRGRVGRSTRMAYAYFLYRRGKVLQEAAEKRLEAIGELTEFGSGFKIAMRDLEIRGAGNVLGPEQHGHMGAVGYELYCKLLQEAMSRVMHQPVAESFETTVYIKVNAYLPSTYIANESQKLDIYKKIAAIRGEEDYYDMQDELTDRYADMPQCVSNLLDISYIKALANQSGSDLLSYKKGMLSLQLRPDAPLDPIKLTTYLSEHKGDAWFVSDQKNAKLTLRIEDSAKDQILLRRIKEAMQSIWALRQEPEAAS
ncbi:MAG: transcription-repair coupling factor [Lachnospiraceae bacterium]|jgi:transcription-repair coupling factor (superfamily II helicase)|nr:transcription-repair coupling factor [Lachnospiraceae bacterium]